MGYAYFITKNWLVTRVLASRTYWDGKSHINFHHHGWIVSVQSSSVWDEEQKYFLSEIDEQSTGRMFCVWRWHFVIQWKLVGTSAVTERSIQEAGCCQSHCIFDGKSFCASWCGISRFQVGNDKVRSVEPNVKDIVDLPPSTNRKEMLRFLRASGYYRRFCKTFWDDAMPLTKLLSKK